MDGKTKGSMVDRLGGSEVPVLGAGSSGRSVERLLRARGMVPVLYDEKAEETLREFRPGRGRHPFGVVSPGFAPDHPWRQRAERVGLPLLGEVELAASAWVGSLLCITGTNGKTSLTRFLEQALVLEGTSARACGNIGDPFADLAAEPGPCEWAVCEVSSFQLYDWQRPHAEAAIWTNFAEDHLDWHGSLADYFGAKWRLVEAGMPVFAGAGVAAVAESLGYTIPENLVEVAGDPSNPPTRGIFSQNPYGELYALAEAWWMQSGRDPAVLAEAALAFEPLPHRMEPVGSAGGRRFINDSKATNFHAALAACRSLDPPVHWIGGGSSKGVELSGFAQEMAGRVVSADLFGATASDLARELAALGMPVGVYETLEEAVRSAARRSAAGSTVLLSPGFASFDQFSGYAERGERFRKCVKELSRGTELL